MEWEMAAATASDYCSTVAHMSNGAEDGERREGMGVLCVKMMTDEQMEVLRRQISAYATICEQLAEMHRAVTAHQDSLAGMRLGSMYSDALMAPPTARPRWTPTPVQLQILESIYDRESGALGKQRIKGIALELLQYGQISESNVYNWFQNRKARTKRKQTATLPNMESEIEADVEAPNEKRSKSGGTHPNERLPPRADDLSLHRTDTNSVLHSVGAAAGGRQGMYTVNDAAKSIGDLGQMPFCENEMLNPRLMQPQRGS